MKKGARFWSPPLRQALVFYTCRALSPNLFLNPVGTGENKKKHLSYNENYKRNIVMSRKRDKIWTAIIATKQWFSKLFTSEADALVDDFGNNPPPDIGTQPYSGEDNKKGD